MSQDRIPQAPSPKPQAPLTHALSFDIEDWFHMVEIEAVADVTKWPTLPSIVVDRTKWIVDLVGEYQTKATFFILGWVAERYPEIAKYVAAQGHEVGTHSHWHRKVYELTPEAFHDDMKHSIDVLSDQIGGPIRGFRAPSFSITPGTEWAFDVLLDLGITYDASLFPASRGHGGYDCAQRAHEVIAPSGRALPELPMSIMSVGPARIPFSGGGYMRFLPGWAIRRGFRDFERQKTPVVVYLHPRDFEVNCPRVPMPLKRRFKCYVGMKTTEGKLRGLLKTRRFDTCAAVLAQQGCPALHERGTGVEGKPVAGPSVYSPARVTPSAHAEPTR